MYQLGIVEIKKKSCLKPIKKLCIEIKFEFSLKGGHF